MNEQSDTDNIQRKKIEALHGGQKIQKLESIISEVPLEIRLSHESQQSGRSVQMAITMRTPGHDEDLIMGLLFSEGIIHQKNHVARINRIEKNVCEAILDKDYHYDFSLLQSRMVMSSSCGICGKSNLEAVEFESRMLSWSSKCSIDANIVLGLPGAMLAQQSLFHETGGVHAATLFDLDGNMMMIREDIGRHNAMDKLIGSSLGFDLGKTFTLVSGRVSFEICQKAAMAGLPLVAGIGPASSLAVEVAEQEGITLIGFLKDSGFNIYCHADRITFN